MQMTLIKLQEDCYKDLMILWISLAIILALGTNQYSDSLIIAHRNVDLQPFAQDLEDRKNSPKLNDKI